MSESSLFLFSRFFYSGIKQEFLFFHLSKQAFGLIFRELAADDGFCELPRWILKLFVLFFELTDSLGDVVSLVFFSFSCWILNPGIKKTFFCLRLSLLISSQNFRVKDDRRVNLRAGIDTFPSFDWNYDLKSRRRILSIKSKNTVPLL